MKTLIPLKIDIISQDGPDCCTISGPTEIIEEFIEELKMKNISFREMHTSNFAYHSRIITSADWKLTSQLEKVKLS